MQQTLINLAKVIPKVRLMTFVTKEVFLTKIEHSLKKY